MKRPEPFVTARVLDAPRAGKRHGFACTFDKLAVYLAGLGGAPP